MKVRSRYPSRRYDGIPSIKKVSRTIALTRERFANDKLRDLLCGLQCYELPCIDFISTVNIAELGQLLQSNDQVVITSPQSATVFISAWTELGKPAIKVVSVGEGTSKPLQSAGIVPVFVPSDSTALTLAKELPVTHGMRVLYPTSAIADGKLVGGLKDREFEVRVAGAYWCGFCLSLCNLVFCR
jgi:uroporphyrinogen-III synthase